MSENGKRTVKSIATEYGIDPKVLVQKMVEKGCSVDGSVSPVSDKDFETVKGLIPALASDSQKNAKSDTKQNVAPGIRPRNKADDSASKANPGNAMLSKAKVVVKKVERPATPVATVAPVSVTPSKNEVSEKNIPEVKVETAPKGTSSSVTPVKVVKETAEAEVVVKAESAPAVKTPKVSEASTPIEKPASVVDVESVNPPAADSKLQDAKNNSESSLKVKVEVNEELAARIARYQQAQQKNSAPNQARRPAGDDKGMGYTGNFKSASRNNDPRGPQGIQGDRPQPAGQGGQRPFNGGGQGQRPYGDRPQGQGGQGGQRPYGDRPQGQGGQGGQRPYGDRPQGQGGQGGQRPYGDRPQGQGGQGGQRPYGDRPQGQGGQGGQRPYGDRPQGQGGQGGQRPYGDRPQGQGGQGGQRPFNGGGQAGGIGGQRPPMAGGGAFGAHANPMAFPPPALDGRSGKPGAKVNKPDPKKKVQDKKEKENVQVLETKTNVSRVMASLSKNPSKKVYKKGPREEGDNENRKVIQVSDFVTVGELAGLLGQSPSRVIAKLMELGMMVTINHRVDFETIQLIADEFEFDVELMEEYEVIDEAEELNDEEALTSRPPVVTVMGHVDHGKTSLLDHIRKTKVVSGEAGGITQHVGAYSVQTANGPVTFLDTPGHEAFTAMRARGSQVTDVVVLIVAADDRVMPQTVESIEHARAAKVPIVVAINKVDLETANPEKIRAQLAERGVVVEQYGGPVSCVEISAKKGIGVDQLLEVLALETEVLQLRANANVPARGTVIESRLDKGKGAVATVLIEQGTLRVGEPFVTGIYSGRVRALLDSAGKEMAECGPGMPCQIMGMEGAPYSGDKLNVVEDEKTARDIAAKRRQAAQERDRQRKQQSILDKFAEQGRGGYSVLNVIIKADVDGSAEAIASELEKLSNKEVKINIISKAVGNIKESDINLAAASEAVIVAFHLLPSPKLRDIAESEGVEIRQYRIIYQIIEDFKGLIEKSLKPIIREEVAGEADVKQLFRVSKVGLIAGCMVSHGTVDIEAKLRIYRNGLEIGTGKVSSLKRHKEEVKAVKMGFECGIGIEGFDDLREGDTLAFFREITIQRKLGDVEK